MSAPTPDARVALGTRVLTATDAGELLTLQLAAWVAEAHTNATLEIPPLHDGLTDVQAQLLDPAWTIWGLRERGRLLATVRLRMLGADTAFVGRLGVVPDLQGQGLGGAMLRWAHAHAPAATTRIELVTGARSFGNHRFYARHGYAPVDGDTPLGTLRLARTVIPGA